MNELKDFYEEYIRSLLDHNVRFIIFGGFAVNLYGFTRVTEDLDVWVDPDGENLNRLFGAIADLGFPKDTHLTDFIDGKSIMLRLTDDGYRVDQLTKININKPFEEAFKVAVWISLPYGKIPFLSYDDLIDEKIRSKRPKDILDVQQLRKIRKEI